MPQPRKTQVSLDATPYYHCVSRCVRRAFLCGTDHASGRCFEHRRQWIEDRLPSLADIFALDVCAYAVMSNHFHVVLHVDNEQATKWTQLEVVQHWHRLFRGSLLSQRFERGDTLYKAELETLAKVIETWRQRLMDISWYMRCLNEHIAREANREDNCTGRFWEGRFKCQALLDEKALAACLAYVDLNPIRAAMADTPEGSEHTSVKQRIEHAKVTRQPARIDQQPAQLMPFAGYHRNNMPKGLPFRLNDYLDLVEWTGRQMREGKRGSIDFQLPPILQRLELDTRQWGYLTQNFESHFKSLVGTANTVRNACEHFGKRQVHGLSNCQTLFGSG